MQIPYVRRSFATVTRLPLLARRQVRDPRKKPRGAARLLDKLVRLAWRVRRILPASGELEFRTTAGRAVAVRIDGRKHHFIDYASRDAHGGYEPAETALIDAMLPHAKTFYDIGTNWGYFTWLAATNRAFAGRVFAFEIHPAVVGELRAMLAQTPFGNVEVMPFGLSERSGEVGITVGRQDHLTRVSEDGAKRRVSVPVRALDELSALPPPDLIKMDVEDHELAVVRGGAGLFAGHRPAVLFECRDPETADAKELIRFFHDADYVLFRLGEKDGMLSLNRVASDSPGGIPAPSNLFAVPEERIAHWLG